MTNHGIDKPKPPAPVPDVKPDPPKPKPAEIIKPTTTPSKPDPKPVTPTIKEPAPASGGGILMPLLVFVFMLIAAVAGLIATKNFDKALEPVLPDATKTLGLQDLAKTLQDAVDGGAAAADEGKSDL